MGLRRLRPRLGFEQCAIITNVRRIDPVGLLRPKLVPTKSQIWAGFSLPQGVVSKLRTQFLDVDDLRVAAHLARAMDQVLRAARPVRGAVGQRDQRHLFR